MELVKKIYEHLITKKKYNTLKLKYETIKVELENKVVELSTQKRIHHIRKEHFENQIKELTNENIDLKMQIIELEKKKRGRKND